MNKLQLLDNLNDQEKAEVLKILKEVAEKGESPSFDRIKYADYKEVPVDIITFAKHRNYLGNAWHTSSGECKLFPFWESKLKELFPTNITTNYNTAIFTGARGLGKAQPLDEPILTTTGFIPMRDVRVGTELQSPGGGTTKVLEVHPQSSMPVYEIVLQNGATTHSSKQHLWNVFNNEYEEVFKTVDTEYLINSLEVYYIQTVNSDGSEAKRSSIKNIEYIGDNICQCITVDNSNGLYITNDFIVTHNSELSILCATYLMYRVMCLKDPLGYYGLKPTDTIAFAFMNITLDLVEEIGNIKFQNTVKSSPWFLDRGTITGRDVEKWNPPPYINVILGSQPSHVIGQAVLFCFTGDTVIATENGDFKAVDLLDKPVRLYTYNQDLNKVELSNICFIKPTAISDEQIIITLEDNYEFKCTPDHLLLTESGYKKAKELTINNIVVGSHKLNHISAGVRIKSIKHIKLNEPIQYYDAVNVAPYNNFFIKTNDRYIVSHNCFFDEISFIKNNNIDRQKAIAMDMIDTCVGGMKTRFIQKGKNPTLLILASSKRSEKSFLETHVKHIADKEMQKPLIVDEAIWTVKPQGTYLENRFKVAVGNKFLNSEVIKPSLNKNITAEELDVHMEPYLAKGYKIIDVPFELLDDFQKDVDRALCDFAGISSSDLMKYISGAQVQSIINKNTPNPFTKEIIEVGMGDLLEYKDFFNIDLVPAEVKEKPMFIHIDGSLNGDKTGIAGVCIAGKSAGGETEKDLYFRLGFVIAVKAPKGHDIAIKKHRNFIYWLKEQGFNIKGVSYDQYQSAETGQELTYNSIFNKKVSVDEVKDGICQPYSFFKNCIYEKRIELYQQKVLVDGITDLEKSSTGKIDHPTGGQKDCSDAVCGALWLASRNAEQYAYDYGEDLNNVLAINSKSTDNELLTTQDFTDSIRQRGINSIAQFGKTNNSNNNRRQIEVALPEKTVEPLKQEKEDDSITLMEMTTQQGQTQNTRTLIDSSWNTDTFKQNRGEDTWLGEDDIVII